MLLHFSQYYNYNNCNHNYNYIKRVLMHIITPSVKRNLSLLQNVTHWFPKHQHEAYLDTDCVNLSLISTSKKTKVYFNQRGDKCDEIARG